MSQGSSFLKQCAWCCSSDGRPPPASASSLPNGTRLEQKSDRATAEAPDTRFAFGAPAFVASATAVDSPERGEVPCPATASAMGNSAARREVLEGALQRGNEVPKPGLPSSLQDDNLDDEQFMQRVMQLQTQVDFRFRRGPPAELPHSPAYRGSPLWVKWSEPDSDTDADMPELIAAPNCPADASMNGSDHFMSAHEGDFDDGDEDSPRVPLSKMHGGGLGSCWGPAALRGALAAAAADDSPVKDETGPQPF